jgi:crotonobetainyl-CoA:carnitine CoA-transferase CaiB-like acyl-CoA transferase
VIWLPAAPPVIPKNPINAILDALASQRQRGETSLIVRIEPDVIQDAMNALRSYRKLFAPVIPGLTDTVPIYAAYEQMRQADETKYTILLFVECQTMQEFRDAIGRMPIRKSSEWRSFSTTESAGPY